MPHDGYRYSHREWGRHSPHKPWWNNELAVMRAARNRHKQYLHTTKALYGVDSDHYAYEREELRKCLRKYRRACRTAKWEWELEDIDKLCDDARRESGGAGGAGAAAAHDDDDDEDDEEASEEGRSSYGGIGNDTSESDATSCAGSEQGAQIPSVDGQLRSKWMRFLRSTEPQGGNFTVREEY